MVLRRRGRLYEPAVDARGLESQMVGRSLSVERHSVVATQWKWSVLAMDRDGIRPADLLKLRHDLWRIRSVRLESGTKHACIGVDAHLCTVLIIHYR